MMQPLVHVTLAKCVSIVHLMKLKALQICQGQHSQALNNLYCSQQRKVLCIKAKLARAVGRHEQYLLKYLDAFSASYLKISATKIPGMTMSPRPSMEKGVEVSPSSRALGNNNLMGASKDFACIAVPYNPTRHEKV